jgi:hypothetical protein
MHQMLYMNFGKWKPCADPQCNLQNQGSTAKQYTLLMRHLFFFLVTYSVYHIPVVLITKRQT